MNAMKQTTLKPILSSFRVILLTNKQANTDENITFLALLTTYMIQSSSWRVAIDRVTSLAMRVNCDVQITGRRRWCSSTCSMATSPPCFSRTTRALASLRKSSSPRSLARNYLAILVVWLLHTAVRILLAVAACCSSKTITGYSERSCKTPNLPNYLDRWGFVAPDKVTR